MAIIVWKTINPDNQPIPALYQAVSANGDWRALGDKCGNCITDLGPGQYTVTISSLGYVDRVLDAHLADSGVITSQLEYNSVQPTRDAIITVQGNFLNLFDSEDIPVWDAYLSSLLVTGDESKFREWIKILRDAGTTHINLPISYNYDEPLGWIRRYPIPGQDFTGHLDDFSQIVSRIQALGFIPIIKLAFDGQGYDPIGWTYGWQWGMDNAARIVNQLSRFVTNSLWSTGYDGCFPNWTADQTVTMLQLLRNTLGVDGCIDTEFSGPGTMGYCHMGNGEADWVPSKLGILDSFSCMSLVYPPNPSGMQQVAARLLYSKKNIAPENDYNGCYLDAANGKVINVGLYESIAFDIIRKQATSRDATFVANFAANYGFESFGNGLPR
jgi:hypothetical protein